MLTHQLSKDNQLLSVTFSNFSKRFYLKDFQKKYKGKQWDFTEKSIIQDLSRLRMENNTTQLSAQIDELKYDNHEYIVKYDFKIAQTKESTKTSSNRCILYVNEIKNIIIILMIYNKTHLPKNKDETKYIFEQISNNFAYNVINK